MRASMKTTTPLVFCLSIVLTVARVNALPNNPARDNDASRFQFFDIPTILGGPCVVTPGSDGAAWVEEILGNKFARIDPVTGVVTEYPIPWSLEPVLPVQVELDLPIGGITPLSCALAHGADGKVYGSNGLRNQLAAVEPKTGHVEVFSAPNILGDLFPLNDLTASEDSVWFTQTTGNQIGRFFTQNQSIVSYTIPTPLSLPIGVLAGSDGGIWFTEALGNKIGRVDPVTHKIDEYDLPEPLVVPFVIRAETEGRYLWFTCLVGNQIGRIEMATGEIKLFEITSPLVLPVAVCASDEGDIWFSHLVKNVLGKFSPKTEKFEEVGLPGALLPETLPVGILPTFPVELNCKPGNAVWFVEFLANKVGRYDLSKN